MGDFADYVHLLAGPDASTVAVGRAFLRASMETVLPPYDPSDEDLEAAIRFDGKDNLGLDAFYQPDAAPAGEPSEIFLAQAKAGQASAAQQRADVQALLALPATLLTPPARARGNTAVRDVAPLLHDALARGARLRLLYLAGAPLAEPNHYWLANPPLANGLPGFPKAQVDLEIVDAAALESRFAALLGQTAGPACDVEWDMAGAAWHPAPHVGERSSEAPALEITMPAMTFITAYAVHADRLFRFNPRSDLGDNRVNREIAASLRREPQLFRLLNNGITAVCRGFDLVDDDTLSDPSRSARLAIADL